MRKLLLIGLTGLLVLTLFAAALVFTGPGLKVLLRLAPLAGVAVEYAEVSGSLADFQLTGLALDAAGNRVTARRLALQWQPLALLRRQVRVAALEADGLVVDQPPPQAAPADAQPLDLSRGLALPVSVHLERLALRDLALLQAGEATTTITSAMVQNLDLAADRWQIGRLEVTTENATVALDGWLSPTPELAHELHLTARSGNNDVKVAAAGNASLTRVDVDLNQAAVTAGARLSNWTDDPSWELTVNADQYQGVNEAEFEGSGNLRSGQGMAQVLLDDRTIELRDWHFSRNAQQHWVIHLDGDSAPVKVVADLELDGSRLYSSRVQISGDDARVPQAVIEVSGAFTQLALRAAIELSEAAPTGAGQVLLTGQLDNFNQLTIERLSGQLLGGSLDGSGTVAFAEGLDANVALTVDQLNLERLHQQLPNQLSGQIAAVTSDSGGQLRTRLDLGLTAVRQSIPVTVDGHAELVDARPVSAELVVQATTDNRLTLRLMDPESVQVLASLTRLDALLPGAAGQIEADVTGRLVGDWPTFNGSIAVDRLALPNQITVREARVLLQTEAAELTAGGVSAAGQQLRELRLTIAGAPESHRFSLAASADAWQLQTAGSAAFADQRYQYQLDTLSAGLPRDLTIANENPVRGVVAAARIRVDPACLVGGQLRICVAADYGADAASGSLTLNTPAVEDLPWRELQPGLETLLLPQGTLAADLKLDSEGDQLRFDGHLDLATLRIQEVGGDGLEIKQLALVMAGTPQRANLALAAQLPGGELKGAVDLTDLLSAPALDGSISANLANLAVLSVLIPDAQLEQGSAQVDLSLSGPLSAPAVAGTVALAGVGADLPQLGIKPAVDLTITLPADGNGRFDGVVVSGAGRATLSGDASWDGALRLHGELNGSQLLIANSDNVSLAASPALSIDIAGGETRVGGSINVDRGFVALATGTSGGPSASQDVIIVDAADQEPAPSASKLALDVRVVLDQPVEISGFGLAGELAGKIAIRQQPGEPLLANGELNLTGQYAAFGQKLSITEGRLIYVNTPLDDPAIELYAGREVDGVKVGVRVTGRASALSAALESVPSLNESEQLSLLVLGRRLGALDETQSNQLATAAVSLALSQGNKALGGMGGGMPNLSLTQELGGLAVAIGKQLSPRLYVGYTVDLLQPVQLVRVRYQISESWTAETELGLESRGAIRYRRER